MNVDTQKLDELDLLVSLAPYEEIVGRLESIHREGPFLVIELSSGTLAYPTSTREAEICVRELNGHEKERVSILRTTDLTMPVVICTPEVE